MSFMSPPVFDRQIHTDPPGRQPDTLLLIHAHAGIIPLQQRGVLPLSPQILYELIRLHGCEVVLVLVDIVGEALAQTLVERRSNPWGAGGLWFGWELPK